MTDWIKIKKEFVSGRATLAELAEKYTVSISTLKKKCASEKWADERNHNGTKVNLKVQQFAEKQGDKKAQVLSSSARAAERLNEIIINCMSTGGDMMRAQDASQLATALEKNTRTLMLLYRIPDIKTEAELERLRLETDQRKKELNNEQTGVKIRIEAPEEGLDE